MKLVTLEQAEDHLRLDDADIENLEFQIDMASGIVLNYLEVDTEASPVTLPWVDGSQNHHNVQAAVLLVLSELNENRESSNSDPLSPTVKNLLRRIRNPAFA